MLKKLFVLFILCTFPNALLAKNASEFYENEDYDAAYRAAYADALDGDPESSFIIGKILIDGKGSADENLNKGIQFITSAAESDYLKAVIFLAKDYEEGKYASKSSSKSLKYYEQCEKLGGPRSCNKKVTSLRKKSFGAISKKSCVRYNKKDKENFYNIGQCIVRNYLEGNASSYFLKAFDNGNKGAYLLASERMLKEKDINLMPLVKRIPEFKRQASKSQKTKFIKQIKRYGYDGSFCGKLKNKSSKKNMFAKPKTTGGNNAACALAAEAGDPTALPIAYEWWNNGLKGFPKAKKYAQQLMENLESNDDVDIVSVLRKFENDPKKHFKKAMEYIKSNPLASKIVGKELKLEIGLIANGDALAFASEYRDIANVIEYIDWNAVNSKVLAKFYRQYKIELLEQEHDGELETPRVKKNLKNIPFKTSFVKTLGSLEDGGELAYNYLTSVIFNDCKALDYALKNIDELDIPMDLIQDAQSNLINKCDLKVAKLSMKELLDKAYRDLDTYKIPVENRMNKKRLDCNDYNDFLKYNRRDPSDFEIDYDRNNEICATFPVVSYQLATKAYKEEQYDEAYKYSLKGCENEDHPSKGCDLLAMITTVW